MRALRCRQCAQPLNRRGLAAPASGSFHYQTGEAAGVKFASRDLSGPTTTLALVAKAGTRYQSYPGLTEGLEKYAFRNTERRSALRIVRESDLLGAKIFAYHSRENLVIGAKFLRDDLPYYAELLAEVAGQTKYLPHEYTEEVHPQIEMARKNHLANTKSIAWESVHSLAFHRGLGTPIYPTSSTPVSKYVDSYSIADYANAAYAKQNIAIVGNGIEDGQLQKWVGQFFQQLPSSGALSGQQTKYYGGEERIAHNAGNTVILAFPGSSSFTGGFYKPEIAVLASLLGGQSSIKWSTGFSLLAKATEGTGARATTKSAIYSDAGLLTVVIEGKAEDVAKAAQNAVETIKKVAGGDIAKEDFKKAVAHAKFTELEFGQDINAGLELTGSGLASGGKAYQLDETAKLIDGVSEEALKNVAKSLLEHKASVSAVGDLHVLPYAEELGLKV